MSAIFPECPICFESLDHNLITSISCGHIFHHECLNNWMNKNKMVCPICRGNASHTLKLIYDIKFTQSNSQQSNNNGNGIDTIQSTQEIIKQNKKLSRANEILTNQIEQLKAEYAGVQKTIDDTISLYKTYEESNKEYKKNALHYHVKYDDSQEQCEILKTELDRCTTVLRECEKEINEKNAIIRSSKAIDDLMKRKDVITVKDTIEELLNKDDNKRTLIEYVFILQEKINSLQKDNEELKNKVHEKNGNNSLLQKNNDSTLIRVIGDNFKPNKRKYNDFAADYDKYNEVNDKEEDDLNESNDKKQATTTQSVKKYNNKPATGIMIHNASLTNSHSNANPNPNSNATNNGNNTIRMFNNPLGGINQKISFLNQNKKK